ncbi:MAG: glucuronate isomerase [Clostridia bacterium]|nr:glucuronate isomerase [Clostridia bacterium]
MKPFLDKDFLLSTPTARKLYHEFAVCPIIDYHCHVSPKEIFEDKHFENITEVWLGGDHYKWRLMRGCGVEEYYITGDASAREKFQKFAECLPLAIGNPMYHWCHLELKNYFGFEGILNGETAEAVWQLTEEKLKSADMGVRGLIEKSGVVFIGTTDDPVDSLEWHEKIKNDATISTVVGPSFRPDKALNIDKAGWAEYIGQLACVSGVDIHDIHTLKEALRRRMEHFDRNGCLASDHGLDFMVWKEADAATLDNIIAKGLAGECVSAEEAAALKTELLVFCGTCYNELGWVMQIHYNCLRNPNTKMLQQLGPDTGFDCIGPHNGSRALANVLDALYQKDALPRTVLYSLDNSDNAFLDTLMGAFQGSEIAGKIQHGSAWWFNDHKQGMTEQLVSLGNLGVLGNFIGMLTDSRSFLSYARHEYFRRILCDLIGTWVENGEYPDDMTALERIVKGICFENAKKYFKL